MDLVDKITLIGTKAQKLQNSLETEEATKNALIMPFIAALGYDVFDPSEVHPEFCADIGTKKGEKVDYAIKKDDQVIILMECKSSKTDLQKDHMSQLFRYFHVTSARFGVLTNGIQYYFYSDIEEANKMDEIPFFIFDLMNYTEQHISELKKFSKSMFSQEEIVTAARVLKTSRSIKIILEQELENPSKQFVSFFASRIHNGKLTSNVLDAFTPIVKTAFLQFIKGKVSDSLQTALIKNEETEPPVTQTLEQEENDTGKEHVTTPLEQKGFFMIQAISSDLIDADRVTIRDAKTYCAILLDDNNRKPICRLWFNTGNLYISLFCQKKEEKIPINRISDIYKYADRIKDTIKEYTT